MTTFQIFITAALIKIVFLQRFFVRNMRSVMSPANMYYLISRFYNDRCGYLAAVVQTCFLKMLSLKFLKRLQKTTCAGLSLLIKLQARTIGFFCVERSHFTTHFLLNLGLIPKFALTTNYYNSAFSLTFMSPAYQIIKFLS